MPDIKEEDMTDLQGEGRKGGTEEYRSNTNRERVRGYRDMKEFVIKGIRFVRTERNQGSC